MQPRCRTSTVPCDPTDMGPWPGGVAGHARPSGRYAETANRSVVGIMNEFSHLADVS